MARPRMILHEILKAITPNVYFQPPTNVQLSFPCIVYKRDYANTGFADDRPYTHYKRYQITVIDRNPDSNIPEKIAMLPMSIFNRFYTANDLNHDVYSLYF